MIDAKTEPKFKAGDLVCHKTDVTQCRPWVVLGIHESGDVYNLSRDVHAEGLKTAGGEPVFAANIRATEHELTAYVPQPKFEPCRSPSESPAYSAENGWVDDGDEASPMDGLVCKAKAFDVKVATTPAEILRLVADRINNDGFEELAGEIDDIADEHEELTAADAEGETPEGAVPVGTKDLLNIVADDLRNEGFVSLANQIDTVKSEYEKATQEEAANDAEKPAF
jgi:hypothetical protein